jgi:hypothetical protein
MDVDCCSSNTYTLNAGDQFNFVNYTSQAVGISNCNPPLAAIAYNVPAAQNGNPGVCQAQVATGCQPGSYPLTNSGCSNPTPHCPTIQVSA